MFYVWWIDTSVTREARVAEFDSMAHAEAFATYVEAQLENANVGTSYTRP